MLQEVWIFPTLVLVPIFGLEWCERVKGLFRQKNAPKPDVLCLGEGVHQGEGLLA